MPKGDELYQLVYFIFISLLVINDDRALQQRYRFALVYIHDGFGIGFLFHFGLFIKDFLLVLDIHTLRKTMELIAVVSTLSYIFSVNRIDGRGVIVRFGCIDLG